MARRGERKAVETEAICSHCGEAFSYVWTLGPPRLHCSKNCGSKAYKARCRASGQRPPSMVHVPVVPSAGVCACGVQVPYGRRVCEPCQERDRAEYNLAYLERARARVREVSNGCLWCGGVVSTSDKWQRCCSASCSDARKRASVLRSKAIERGCDRDGAQYIDPVELFASQAWRCHWCGGHTPSDLRGLHADASPEVDHVKPIAEGGEHTACNVVGSCRLCNRTRPGGGGEVGGG